MLLMFGAGCPSLREFARVLFSPLAMLLMAAIMLVAPSAVGQGGSGSVGAVGSSAVAPAAPGAEVRAQWTESSRTWVTDEGMYVTRLFGDEVNFRDGAGRWQKVDNRLADSTDANYGWENAANDFRVKVPERLGDRALRIEDGDRWLALRLHGVDVAADVDGARATFPGVGRGASAEWTTLGNGVKEELILDSADAQREFVFSLDVAAGLSVAEARDGGIVVTDDAGRTRFSLPAPFAEDAAGRRAPKSAVSMNLAPAGGHWELTLRVDHTQRPAPSQWSSTRRRTWALRTRTAIWMSSTRRRVCARRT
jgi:hypothetical protein